jgi:hypothetical protein
MNIKEEFIVVGYYTGETIYEPKAAILQASLEKFAVPYYLQRIEDKGGWYANTCYKPTFLREMLEKFPDHNIIYVDCDAEFMKFPELFYTFEGDVGVYLFDRSCYSKSEHGFEILSGTIFLRNKEAVSLMVEGWELECKRNPSVWDQKSLQKILGDDYEKLPGEYCKIFDRMEWITEPVIVHYQASREVRKNRMKIT